MKRLARTGSGDEAQLSVEERNLLSVAYKNVVGAMLKEFDVNLPQYMGDLAVNLTPEGQKNKYQGDVNRALIMKHLDGKDSGESERIDDFGGNF